MAAPEAKQPKLTQLGITSIPHPHWRAQHGRKGAPKPVHPRIAVIAYIDEEGNPWIYDELSGLRRIERALNAEGG